MFRLIFIVPFLCLTAVSAEETFEFTGNHFLASFMKCDKERMGDSEKLADVMQKAVQLTGAGILDDRRHFFEPQGMTQVLLLSESHASIHTYPEHGACFVDLFTCGEKCDWKPFFEELRNFLKCEDYSALLLIRGEDVKIVETSFNCTAQ
jgi:S-adenosylmethionine decarboxylase